MKDQSVILDIQALPRELTLEEWMNIKNQYKTILWDSSQSPFEPKIAWSYEAINDLDLKLVDFNGLTQEQKEAYRKI